MKWERGKKGRGKERERGKGRGRRKDRGINVRGGGSDRGRQGRKESTYTKVLIAQECNLLMTY